MQIIQLTVLVEIEGISIVPIFLSHNFNSLLEMLHTCESTHDFADLTTATSGVKR